MLKNVWILCLFIFQLQTSFANTDSAEIKNLQGLRLLQEEKPLESETFFKQAIAENNQVKYYYNNLAVSLMLQKKYEEAIVQLNKAILLDQTYVKAVSNLAACYFYLAEFKKAYSYYKLAEKIDKDYVKARFTREKIKHKTKTIKDINITEDEIDKVIDSLTNN